MNNNLIINYIDNNKKFNKEYYNIITTSKENFISSYFLYHFDLNHKYIENIPLDRIENYKPYDIYDDIVNYLIITFDNIKEIFYIFNENSINLFDNYKYLLRDLIIYNNRNIDINIKTLKIQLDYYKEYIINLNIDDKLYFEMLKCKKNNSLYLYNYLYKEDHRKLLEKLGHDFKLNNYLNNILKTSHKIDNYVNVID